MIGVLRRFDGLVKFDAFWVNRYRFEAEEDEVESMKYCLEGMWYGVESMLNGLEAVRNGR